MYPEWLIGPKRGEVYYPVVARSPQQHALWLAAMQNMAPLPWPPAASKEVSNGR